MTSLDEAIMPTTPARTRYRYQMLSRYAQEYSFGVLDKEIVVIDTETTGLSFTKDELIQIAAARYCEGQIVEWYVTFVNPGIPIPDEVAHLTNITNADVEGAPSPAEALQGLVEFVGDAPLLAHNASFDRTFVTKYLAGAKLKENLWLDSLDLSRIALPRLTSHRLLDLVRAFNGPESTHRADDDVVATCWLYRLLLAAVATMPPALVGYIASTSDVNRWNTAFVFQQISEMQSLQTQSKPGFFTLHGARVAAVEDLTTRLRTDQQAANEEGQTDASGNVSRETFASDAEIEQAFSKEGIVGSLYCGYENREEQKLMALSVNNALVSSRNLAVEAGTGVGKSMAYLVPLAYTARRSGSGVGVATKTNALLDQLMSKELPLLSQAFDITYAAIKGYTHYPCLRKVQRVCKKGPQVREYKNQTLYQAPALAALLSFIEQSDYDDMDDLKIDYRAIPRRAITTNSAECLKRKCPFYGKTCFVHGARELAQRSDIVVTNHSLLFLDACMDGCLLPPLRYWVVDEAHGAEDEARRAASLELSSEQLRSLMMRCSGEEASKNVFVRAMRDDSVPSDSETLYKALVAKGLRAGEAFSVAAQEFIHTAKDLLYFDEQSRRSSYEYFDLWLNDDIRTSKVYQGVSAVAKSAEDALEKLIAATRDIVALLEQMEAEGSIQRQLALLALELREAYEAFDALFMREGRNVVRSVRLCRTASTFDEVFTIAPIDVGAVLDESLYARTSSVIYTSATLLVDGSFSAFEDAMGLNRDEESAADFVEIASSYDFDTNMCVYVPTDMPEPNTKDYLPVLSEFLTELHLAQQGSMLTLFTNRKEMEKSYSEVRDALKPHDLRVVCQKWGVSTKGLRDDFLKDESLSLFALKSFWQGFDAPGSTLRGVIIPKLPFALPNDPLYKERELLDNRAWAHYILPAAVIDIKQAVGRLIRTASDSGIVVLADSRLLTKNYGQKFFNSLPTKTIRKLPRAQIVEELRQRYAQEDTSGQGTGRQVTGHATAPTATTPSITGNAAVSSKGEEPAVAPIEEHLGCGNQLEGCSHG